MQFFEDANGDYYPISKIVSMSPSRTYGRGDNKTVVEPSITITDGSSLTNLKVGPGTISRVLKSSATMVPAAPGFYLLVFWYNPELFEDGDQEQYKPWIDAHPIVAWRTDGYDGTEPVIFEDVEGAQFAPAILEPQGAVHDTVEGTTWATRDAWESDMLSKAKLRHDKIAKKE